MNVIIALAFSLIPISWLYAEFKLGRTVRVSLGLLSIVGISLLTYSLGQITPSYELAWHHSSVKLAEELLAKGETNRVQEAFDIYNSMAATGSTFRASEKMWHILKHE